MHFKKNTFMIKIIKKKNITNLLKVFKELELQNKRSQF